MNEWRKVKLREIGEITSSKRIFRAEYKKVGVPFYRGKEIIQKANNQEVSDEFFISLEKYEEIKNKYSVPLENDILITSVGTVGIPYIVKNEKFYFKDGNINWIKKYANNIYFKYLYYWFISPIGKNQIDSYLIGSTQKALTIEAIKKLEINLPPLNTQKKIAKILSDIDSKVELNNTINNNLEEQIQVLFSKWLSNNFKFSNKVTLEEVCSKITDGSHFSPKDNSLSSIPMLSVKDMEKFDFNLKSCKHISETDYQKMLMNDCVPKINDILVAKDGSYLKEIFICNEERRIAILSSIAIFRPNLKKIYPEILLAFLKSPNLLKEVRDNYVSGSALPRIVLRDFKKLSFYLPSIEIQSEISSLFYSIRKQIAKNIMENEKLINLKNYLLPKLMNGEIDVEKIEL